MNLLLLLSAFKKRIQVEVCVDYHYDNQGDGHFRF